MRFTRRLLLRSTLAGSLLAACGHRAAAPSDRCAYCGMRIPTGSHWAAGANDASGHALSFDTPGCLFRYRTSPRGAGLRDAWVTEYYGPAGAHADANTVRFVVGSDVAGPMGPDLVPVAPVHLDAFRADHHAGTDYSWDAVTADVLRAL